MAAEVNINSVFEGLISESPATEAPAEETATPEGDAETPEASAPEDGDAEESLEPKKAAKPVKKKPGTWRMDESLFSEEALATPEGAKAAAEHAMLGKREIHGMLHAAREEKGRLEKQKDEFKRDRDAISQQYEMFRQTTSELVNTTDPARAWQLLGHLTGKDPVKLYEDFSLNVAGIKQQDPEKQALRQELDEIKNYLRNNQQNVRVQGMKGQLEQLKDGLLQKAQNAQGYPEAREFSRADPEHAKQVLFDIKRRAFDQYGSPIGDREALSILESNLRSFRGTAQPQRGSQREATPGKLRHSPGIMPSDASSPARRREMTEEERIESLAGDQNFMRELGFAI